MQSEWSECQRFDPLRLADWMRLLVCGLWEEADRGQGYIEACANLMHSETSCFPERASVGIIMQVEPNHLFGIQKRVIQRVQGAIVTNCPLPWWFPRRVCQASQNGRFPLSPGAAPSRIGGPRTPTETLGRGTWSAWTWSLQPSPEVLLHV